MTERERDSGSVAEAVREIKADVREIKDVLLDPENGMAGRLKLLEHQMGDVLKARSADAAIIAEMKFSHSILKWVVISLGGIGLTGAAAWVASLAG
jgi:hypothetical protein